MNSCFNWFETGGQRRGAGEPKDIYNIVTKVTSTYTVDENRIFVAGFSAGAYMAPVLGATYPDVYSGIVVNSGGAFKSATSMTNAFTVMSSGASASSSSIGSNIVSAMGNYKRVIPCIVFQGTSDYTVGSKNGTQAAESWAYAMNKIDSTVKTSGTSSNGTSSGGAKLKQFKPKSFSPAAYSRGTRDIVHFRVDRLNVIPDPSSGTAQRYIQGIRN
jgi:poly(hydroxyalkanoate) depolymerase family esterase